MKIVVDDRIPYIRGSLAGLGAEVVYKEGCSICRDDLLDADALIVRTRTRCDRALLEDTAVRFVATATIGFDHIDTVYLESAGIEWTNCPGCNAGSVAQYVESCLLLLQRDFCMSLPSLTIGIVGCGHVGSKVKSVAERLGMRVLVNDPPRQNVECETESDIRFVSLGELEKQADIITFHVPMVKDGIYATWHLADRDFFSRLKKQPVIINTSRGAVVDNDALLRALNCGFVRQAIVDTWENEPDIDRILLNNVYIGTPHIAGYSADGKVNADNMVIDALCRFFHLRHPGVIVPPPLPVGVACNGDPLQIYNPVYDSERLKSRPQDFELLRGNYPLRREKL